VASYVLEAIREGILEGRLPVGSRLNQEALAEELGASIIPVRESLRRLEAEGLVTITPRRGAYVAELSPSGLAEIYLMREALEELAVRLAVAKLEPERLDQLGRLNAELRTVPDDTGGRWEALNRRWHDTLYAGAQAPLLLELIGLLWDRSTLSRRVKMRDTALLAVAVEDHDRILEACRAGDAETAAAEMRRHIQRAGYAAKAAAAPAA
jgi:DNA-binding GntR family transcriptional regulator